MIIIYILFLIIFISIFIPKRYLFGYFFLMIFLFGLFFLKIEPPQETDLYRHYQMVEIIKKIPFTALFDGTLSSNMNILLASYTKEYPLYVFYLWVCSIVGGKGFLLYLTSVIVLLVSYYIIRDQVKICNVDDNHKIILLFSFALCNINYLDITGIRNILCASLFCLILYFDLVKQKNTLLCIALYFLLALVHSYAFVLLLFRLMLFLYNKKNRIFLFSFIFLLFAGLLNQGAGLLNIFSEMGINIQSINIALKRLVMYTGNREYSFMVELAQTVIYVILFIIFLFCKNRIKNNKLDELCSYIEIVFLFSLCTFTLRDFFLRMRMILYLLIIPVITNSLYAYKKNSNFSFVFTNRRDIIMLFLICMEIIYTLGLYTYIGYNALATWML